MRRPVRVGPGGDAGGDQRGAEGHDVGRHMAGVGEQRERAAEQARDQLDDEEAADEHERDAAAASGAVAPGWP